MHDEENKKMSTLGVWTFISVYYNIGTPLLLIKWHRTLGDFYLSICHDKFKISYLFSNFDILGIF